MLLLETRKICISVTKYAINVVLLLLLFVLSCFIFISLFFALLISFLTLGHWRESNFTLVMFIIHCTLLYFFISPGISTSLRLTKSLDRPSASADVDLGILNSEHRYIFCRYLIITMLKKIFQKQNSDLATFCLFVDNLYNSILKHLFPMLHWKQVPPLPLIPLNILLYLLKTSKNQKVFYFFKEYRDELLGRNALMAKCFAVRSSRWRCFIKKVSQYFEIFFNIKSTPILKNMC